MPRRNHEVEKRRVGDSLRGDLKKMLDPEDKDCRKMGGTGMACNAGPMLGIAASAYIRAKESAATDRDPKAMKEAIVAIVFSAAAVEAFVNEAAEVARMAIEFNAWHQQAPDPPAVGRFIKLMKELEEAKGSPRLKYMIAMFAFGAEYDSGMHPFQDFELLFRVRNELAHLKPETWRIRRTEDGGTEEYSASTEKLLSMLRAKSITATLAAMSHHGHGKPGSGRDLGHLKSMVPA